MRTLTLSLLLAAPAYADINPINMKLGDAGPIETLQVKELTITEVGDDWLAVRCKSFRPTFTFLVRGVSTTGLVDNKPWRPGKAAFKVEKTEKYKGETVFVIRPESLKE